MDRDIDWVKPVVVLLIAQHVAAFSMSRAIGYDQRPPTVSYMVMALVLATIGGFAILCRHLWRLWRLEEAHPIARLRSDTDWTAVISYFLGFQLVALQIAALTWLKEILPWTVPYWADPALAAFDRALLGVDAWRLFPEWAVAPLDAIYVFWGPFKFFVLILMLVLPPSRLKSQAVLSYFLTVGIVGVAGQYLLSSVGPVFYDQYQGSSDFAALTSRIHEHAPVVVKASEHLWQAYSGGYSAIGGGISAMPSVHVATTTWAALALTRFWRFAAVPAWAFWLLIVAGSVALGWHYLADGIAGAAGALGCWYLAPRLLRWLAGNPRLSTAAPAEQS